VSPSLADRLFEARHARFVGRDGELSVFESALRAETLPFFILHIFGPGGVGKSTLLQEFAFLSEQYGARPVYLDARYVDLSPDSFIKALGTSLGHNNSASIPDMLDATQRLLERDHAQWLARLNKLFRSGTPPEMPLDGRYRGELVALDLAPGLTQLFQSITAAWMPWLGKTFNASQERGDNIFTQDSYLLARLFNPFYRGFIADQPGTYRGFAFHTYMAPGLMDTDRIVLKIDYDLKENPAPTVRRILDELVQIDEDLYLGKAHVRWWWGGWQTVAYFTLRRDIVSA